MSLCKNKRKRKKLQYTWIVLIFKVLCCGLKLQSWLSVFLRKQYSSFLPEIRIHPEKVEQIIQTHAE